MRNLKAQFLIASWYIACQEMLDEIEVPLNSVELAEIYNVLSAHWFYLRARGLLTEAEQELYQPLLARLWELVYK